MKRILWDGLSLVIIDLGRGNNAHSDLYAAADAMALAAAGELDGGPGAIIRAKVAMAEIRNSVSFLSLEDGEFDITLGYVDEEGNAFNVIFLTDIPVSDEDPIDQDWVDNYGTLSGLDAKYVYVAAQSRDLDTIFPVPVSFIDQDVPVQAKAVAGRTASACGITPLFICNPFETELGGSDLQQAFSEGRLHGRLLRLHPGGPTTAGPGNFGFLQVPGNNDNATASANTIRQFFASGYSPVCYDASEVDLKPGAATSIKAGINTRFDIWEGPFSGNGPRTYAPAENVRKGYKPNDADDPGAQVLATDPGDEANFKAFPPNENMENPGNTELGMFLGSGPWRIDDYFSINHQTTLTLDELPDELDAFNSLNDFPNYDPDDWTNPAAPMPSRYDVYRYEIANGLTGNSSLGGEDGLPMCSEETVNNLPPITDPDRRVIQAAIINCDANEGQLNGAKSVPVEAFASVFMTNPMEGNNSGSVTNPDGGTIDLEVIDITGAGGLGTLDDYIRVEAVLVR
jgi:hypothetical protein